jgi:hypothetical protein
METPASGSLLTATILPLTCFDWARVITGVTRKKMAINSQTEASLLIALVFS